MKNVYLILMTLFIFGCSHSSSYIKPSSKLKEEITFQKVSSSLPNWILHDISNQNYLCSVGSSKIQKDQELTKKIAFIQAKANLAQIIRCYIDSSIKIAKKCTKEECYNNITSYTHISSTQMIKEAKITQYYLDKKSSTYYVQVCSPKIQNKGKK